MSFLFPSWSTAFSPEFHESAKAMLEGALNKGNKPPVIQGRIEVVELSMGKEPPTLTLLEIGDLSLDRFRGILRLGYQGDAWLEIRCRVQANPLSHNPNLLPTAPFPLHTPLAASQPLLVPMTLRLSRLHLRAILILVVSQSKGITLVFKNDPLQNVDVSSTFDSVEVIRGYLQQEIEGQLREMFREDLPGIIHRLSQRWFTGTGVGGKVETPYRDEPGRGLGASASAEDDEESEDEGAEEPFREKPIFPPRAPFTAQAPGSSPRRRASQTVAPRTRRLSSTVSESPTSYTVFPDIEDYDPTYGLRPEGLPTHSGYEAFGRLWEKAREGGGRGLGSLMGAAPVHEEHEGEVDSDFDEADELDEADEDDGQRSFELVEMDEALRAVSRAGSVLGVPPRGEEDQVEWETFPAVGGGVITRPRVYHSQSQIRAPSEAGGSQAMPSPSGTLTGGSVTARASSIGGASSTIGSLRMNPMNHANAPGRYRGTQASAGPSSLRRLVTSRSDVFSSSTPRAPPRSESYSALPPSSSRPPPSKFPTSRSQQFPASSSRPQPPPPAARRRQSTAITASSSHPTSRSSWDTERNLTATTTTHATSALPPSKPLSIAEASPPRGRAPSFAGTSPGKSFPPRHHLAGGITVLPLNNSVSQLATLSHSAQTLSPYARAHEHIAVRSFPHLGKSHLGPHQSVGQGQGQPASADGGAGGRPVKARRKRIYHLHREEAKDDNGEDNAPLSPDLDDIAPVWHDESPGEVSAASKRLSRSGSGSASDPVLWAGVKQGSASLTGLAHQVMAGGGGAVGGMSSLGGGRPSYGRAPASRTSYGFPPSR